MVSKAKAVNVIKSLILPVAIFLIMVVCSGGRFGTADSLRLLLKQSIVPMLVAMAIGSNMIMGMWDFSAGAVVYVCGMLSCALVSQHGGGDGLRLILSILIAVIMTMVTGFLYTGLRIPIIVLTIGLTMLYEGLPKMLGVAVAKIRSRNLVLAREPWCYMFLVALVILFHILYYKRPFGSNVRSIGSNQKIARSAGINVNRTKQVSFLISGVFLGVAGFLYMSNSGTLCPPQSFASTGLIFDAMMGIFIAFFLGKYCNYTFGILIGTLSMQILMFGLVSMGMDTTMRSIVQGIFLIILLSFSANQSRIDQKKRIRQLVQTADDQYKKAMAK